MKQALAFVLALALGAPFGAALLEAPVSGRTYVQIDKFAVPDDYEPSFDGQSLPTNPADVLPLPTGIVALLGGDLVDYPGYVAAWVENAKLPVLRDMLDKEGLSWFIGLDASIDMPHRRIDPADPATRVAAGYPASFPSLPIPHRFVVQFAYPVQEVWLVALEGCGGKVIAPLGTRAYLVDATGFEKLYSCPVATYFSWVDAFLTTDRVAPEHLVEGAKGFVLQFAGGTSLANKASFLPSSFNATPLEEPAPGESGFLAVEATSGEIASFALSDPDLLSVTFQGVAEPSDERQGLIVAGRLQPNGTLGGPGYAAWLAGRGLAGPRNQQMVGIVDSGYDQSQPIEGINPAIIDHHPDLENPERLVALQLFIESGSGDLWDRTGHGTMVAGIISAAPYLYVSPEGYRGGGRDAFGYAYGGGISPQSNLAFAKVPVLGALPQQLDALRFIRNNGSADRAFLCNQSWNLARFPATGPAPDGLNAYDATARFFDQRVLDANTLRDGPQELAIVFSAGNFAYRYSTGPVRYNTVSSPATAKNVISVGATTSWRPVSAGPELECVYDKPERPPLQDAPRADIVGLFSGRADFFGARVVPGTTLPGKKVHQVRVKPDLVAPGVRVFSTVPWGSRSFYKSPVGCKKYEPNPADEGYYYTYGTGTSFAAPVVTGVAALVRKWFIDAGGTLNPSPALVKAALVATADDLSGIQMPTVPPRLQDHRPSPEYGWGRVSLDRATDPAVPRFWNDNRLLMLPAGGMAQYTRTIGDPTRDTSIVLSWSDHPAAVTGENSGPLLIDLDLTVEQLNASGAVVARWYGNLFRENVDPVGGGVTADQVDDGTSKRFTTAPVNLRDGVNNVEAVFIPKNTLPAGQRFRIKIRAQAVAGEKRPFAIYAYNVRRTE